MYRPASQPVAGPQSADIVHGDDQYPSDDLDKFKFPLTTGISNWGEHISDLGFLEQ